jgi:putative RNA 2'-phosphotransferase
MKHDDQLTRHSIFLSLVLRHKPEEIGITLDANGWANVDELLNGMNLLGRVLTRELLEQIVADDEKQRYVFSEDGTRIRASQGHSILVDLQLKQAEPPEFLYHGTASRFFAQIQQEGLKPLSRQYVHLSKDTETAAKVGSRHGQAIILIVFAQQMHNDGLPFYLSDNGIWLTQHVAPKYVKLQD